MPERNLQVAILDGYGPNRAAANLRDRPRRHGFEAGARCIARSLRTNGNACSGTFGGTCKGERNSRRVESNATFHHYCIRGRDCCNRFEPEHSDVESCSRTDFRLDRGGGHWTPCTVCSARERERISAIQPALPCWRVAGQR